MSNLDPWIDSYYVQMDIWQDFWNLIDFVTFVMAIVTIAMYAMKKVFGAVAMSVLEESMQPGNSGKAQNKWLR